MGFVHVHGSGSVNGRALDRGVRVQRYMVTVHGSGFWISLDNELQRVEFRVARIVEAANAGEAQQKALALVAGDAKARPLPGHPPPVLVVEGVEPSLADLSPQPGFAFHPDPE